MNTEIIYMYRDASNYKVYNREIISGELTKEEIEKVFGYCDQEDDIFYFIPQQVGLPEKRFDDITEDDHAWFELQEIKSTDEEPTILLITAKELLKNFEDVTEWQDLFQI